MNDNQHFVRTRPWLTLVVVMFSSESKSNYVPNLHKKTPEKQAPTKKHPPWEKTGISPYPLDLVEQVRAQKVE